MNIIDTEHKKLSSGFFGFRIRRWRITIIATLMIIGLGVISLKNLPKESSPTIELGRIIIKTVYIGASPHDIDELVTSPIEDEIDDVEGIDSIESSSSTNISRITIKLEEGYDVDKAMNDVTSEVDKVDLPSDAEDPVVESIKTDTDGLFNLFIYADVDKVSYEKLITISQQLKNTLESEGVIDSISIQSSDNYDIRVVLDQEKVHQLGLDAMSIANVIRGYVSNVPLGNYQIDTFTYDFRIEKTVENEKRLLNLTIPTSHGSVTLSSIAHIDHDYDDDVTRRIGHYQGKGYHYVSLGFTKPSSVIDIQYAANEAKKLVDEFMQQFQGQGIHYDYGKDVAVKIRQSYNSVQNNGLITLVLVFFAVLFFVSFKESVIATLSIPLAFLLTFIVFKMMGMTLNFLINFSMIVTFGIAIDTIIVMLEGAAEKRKLGYSPYSSALLALHEFKIPLIASTATTCVVFIPLFTLPGTMGKYLSFIPITIFTVLVSALIVSLLINPTLFYLFNKDKKTYISTSEEHYFSDDEKQLLLEERKGKEEISIRSTSRRHRIMNTLGSMYEGLVRKLVYAKRGWKRFLFLFPLLLFVGSMMLPIKSTQFPKSDAEFMQLTISGPAGSHRSFFDEYIDRFESVLSSYPELRNYSYTIKGNKVVVDLELHLSSERSRQGQKDSFALTDEMMKDIHFLETHGMKLDLVAMTGGPPPVKDVGVDLIAQNGTYLTQLQEVAKDFELFFQEQPSLIEVVNSNQQTAGQFVFTYKQSVLQSLGLTPGQLNAYIASSMNGVKAGTISSWYHDHDVKVVFDSYIDKVSPDDVENMVINTQAGKVRLGDVAEYTTQSNINAITRKDGKITISVGADTIPGLVADDVEPAIIAFAENYTFPTGIHYTLAGEKAEHANVNSALMMGLILALFMIFMILVLQFNSFRMPLFIFYSIMMALMGANIGLFITHNPRSMAFSIGFISLVGIVVNDAIVFVDKINVNIRRGMKRKEAIIDAGKTRLAPILLTTITTILGLSSIVREDAFFSGLGYTIIFGLFVGSFMTLFIVPILYSLFVSESKVEEMRNM